MKIYKSRAYRIILNLIYGLAVGVIAFFVSQIWLVEAAAIAIAAAAYLLFIWLVILGNVITITVDDTCLTVKKGRRETRYALAEHDFAGRIKTSGGDSECTLYVTDFSGNRTSIDCELIGVGNFNRLLEDLGIIGENASVTRLDTEKKS